MLAVVCAVGMWTYINRVLISHQVREDALYGRPRGNLSDLYPRWLGARELLLHGRDPYSAELTREMQTGYYGRPLDPEGTADRNYRQGFYYPLYVAFGLAPTIRLSFAKVSKGFFWVLLSLTVLTTPLWPGLVHWRLPLWGQASLILITIGSLPFIEGLLLQQMTLLVIALLAIAMALWASDWPIPAGILLAFATIKPQLVCLLLLWLAIWTLGDWRRRYRWTVSFFLTMVILCGASEWYLPHWMVRFWQATREYRRYTGEMSVLDGLIGTRSWIPDVSVLVVLTAVCWRERKIAINTCAFAFTLSLVLAVTALIVPSGGLYNQVLLIPALLVILKDRRTIWRTSIVSRTMIVIAVLLICWPWISATALAVMSFILPYWALERAWGVPLWTATQTPLAVAAVMFFYYYRRTLIAC